MKRKELLHRLEKLVHERTMYLKTIDWMDESQVRRYHEICHKVENIKKKLSNIKRGLPINGFTDEFDYKAN